MGLHSIVSVPVVLGALEYVGGLLMLGLRWHAMETRLESHSG